MLNLGKGGVKNSILLGGHYISNLILTNYSKNTCLCYLRTTSLAIPKTELLPYLGLTELAITTDWFFALTYIVCPPKPANIISPLLVQK